MSESIKHTPGPWEARSDIPYLIAAAPDLLAAAVAQEEAEDFNANNCPGCSEDGSTELPELCEHCFPHFDKARILRRAAIAKAKGK